MKRLTILLVVVLTTICFFSCIKEGAKLYDVSVTIAYPEGYSTTDLSGIKITLVNNLTSREDTARSDASGVASFKLEEGTYTLSASIQTIEFAFNGIKENVSINSLNLNLQVSLVAVALKGGLVFKEIYYTGSTTPTGSGYSSDQFYEIYNNSDETIYLDGLCIGVLDPVNSTTTAWIKNDGSLRDSLPILYHTWMWPGTGQTNPLAPRTSTVLAQDGINHKTDPAGNSNSPINLGGAQWETYVEAPGKDTDSPGVPNLTLVYTTTSTMTDWMSSVSGSAIVLFRLPTGFDYASFVSNPLNFKKRPGSSASTQYLMINKSQVIDAVEAVYTDPTKQNKRLPATLDAGKVFCSGTFIGKSIRRRVDKIIAGKVVYKDTNNSTEDFLANQTPTPFVQPTTVDAR